MSIPKVDIDRSMPPVFVAHLHDVGERADGNDCRFPGGHIATVQSGHLAKEVPGFLDEGRSGGER